LTLNPSLGLHTTTHAERSHFYTDSNNVLANDLDKYGGFDGKLRVEIIMAMCEADFRGCELFTCVLELGLELCHSLNTIFKWSRRCTFLLAICIHEIGSARKQEVSPVRTKEEYSHKIHSSECLFQLGQCSTSSKVKRREPKMFEGGSKVERLSYYIHPQ
jgi:hypothetical protein